MPTEELDGNQPFTEVSDNGRNASYIRERKKGLSGIDPRGAAAMSAESVLGKGWRIFASANI
ncbi:MAG: hypothetical protein E5W56_00275 [Mesorhizobium sp.]|nr:MAG: hypothetical protein E5W56_00275 [Mesorhizobium sp.]